MEGRAASRNSTAMASLTAMIASARRKAFCFEERSHFMYGIARGVARVGSRPSTHRHMFAVVHLWHRLPCDIRVDQKQTGQ
jgi:hypothetical protein